MSIKKTLIVSGIKVYVTRKNIKNLHLAVYPPDGRVTVSAPLAMPISAIRIAIATRITWIYRRQGEFRAMPRQSVRQMVVGESHYYLGNRYRMKVVEGHGYPKISLKGKTTIVLETAPDSTVEARLRALDRWYRARLAELVPDILRKWEIILKLEPTAWRMKKMKTRWGTVNVSKRILTLNPDLAKQPVEYLETVIVHELLHIFEPNHGERFKRLLDRHLPDWRSRKNHLDDALLSERDWN